MSQAQVTNERMDDAWLLEQWERNLTVIGMRDGPDGPAANVLRGFANRVLRFASDPATLYAALSIAFTERERAKAADGVTASSGETLPPSDVDGQPLEPSEAKDAAK